MATGPKGLTENVNCQRYWVPAPMWKKAKQPISRSTPWPFVQRACWWGFSVTRSRSQMLRNDFKHDPHTHSNKTVMKVLAFSLNGIESKSLKKKKRGLFQLLYYFTRTTKSKNYYRSHFDCASYSQEVLELKSILLLTQGTALCWELSLLFVSSVWHELPENRNDVPYVSVPLHLLSSCAKQSLRACRMAEWIKHHNTVNFT